MPSDSRIVVAFNKKGDRMGALQIPELTHLQTSKEWIDDRLIRTPELDGICLIVDWDKRELKIHRHAE